MEHTTPDQWNADVLSYSYNMDYGKIGKCVIINNENFLALGKRKGTQEDVNILEHTFGALGFSVEVAKDLSAAEMLQLLKKVSREDHSEMACFICILLSHGDEGYIHGTDHEVEIKPLLNLFTGEMCPSLLGKPKLFFIQACRGEKYDSGIEVDSMESNSIYFRDIPEEDFLCGYSTVAGYFSWRNESSGSVFIQTLCKVLQEYGKRLEIIKILTRVNNIVAFNFQSNTYYSPTHAKRQMPCIISRLTKELYLTS
ncbi:caspase-7-like [Polypterus senegalus]